MAERRNVETLVVLQPVAVDTANPDCEGMFVIANGLLVAILVRLDAPEHETPGFWFREATLGCLQRIEASPIRDSGECDPMAEASIEAVTRKRSDFFFGRPLMFDPLAIGHPR